MEFNYKEFKEKYGQEAADIVQNEIDSAEDLNLKWQLQVSHENEHWINFLFVTQIDARTFRVYKRSKKIIPKVLISRGECEKILTIMKELGA